MSIGIDAVPAWDARFLHVKASQSRTSTQHEIQGKQESVQEQILKAGKDVSRLEKVVLEAVCAKLSRVLALPREQVHEEDSIAAHGVDSLVAVEIRNWARKELGAEVTVFEVLNGRKSVREVARDIADGIAGKG